MASSKASTADCSLQGQKEQVIDVMFLCDEWKSSKGGLSTFNREFAINMAETATSSMKIHCYVSKSDDQDKEDARQHGVNLITAPSIPGSDDSLWGLKFPPSELPNPHLVIGHGRKLGGCAYFLVKATKCRWIQFVHVYCEDLGKYMESTKAATDSIEENEAKRKRKIELCTAADAVVAVGSVLLQQKYSRSLPNVKVEIITPGIFEKFSSSGSQFTLHRSAKNFQVFLFGRATFEDLSLKGYDIVANAIGSLGKNFELTFVGSPPGEHRKVEQWFLDNKYINRNQLTIRGYCSDPEELKMMFYQSDLVALPSRTEGFGLVALEAISAGVPILVSRECGIAEALRKVEGGNTVIVESDEDADDWARRIREMSEESAEEREANAMRLRENYRKVYSWRTECARFRGMIENVMKTANDEELNIKAEAEECKPKETNMQTTTIPTKSGGCQGVQYQRASAMFPTHSHSETDDCLANKVMSLIAMNYLETKQLESSEDHNKFMDYVREMRVTIKDALCSQPYVISFEGDETHLERGKQKTEVANSGKMKESALQGLGETFNPNEEWSFAEEISPEEDIAPYYVLARGEKSIAAYQRALEEGEILDRRVKVMLIGQDRTGKTNVGHALKGEKFDPNESSTDGVQMHEVLKDVGVQPWKSSILTKETTTYHHKCAELIFKILWTGINQESMTTPNETSTLEQDLPVHPQLNSSPEMEDLKHETSSVPKEKFDEVKQIGPSPNNTPREFQREASWINITRIVDGKLQGNDSDGEEGIWPIIWDFAGQAVYRAIHPIFMSSEAIYLLMVDLSKNLFATAQCRVKENGREEVTIPAPDCNDTNFDHIMRWLDLVHSLRRSRQMPPVILVGTHVDLVVNPEQKLHDLKSTLCHNSRVLSDHIAIALNVDNTKAGIISPQREDTGITKLREKAIKTADKLQQAKRKVPLKWLQVENRVYDMAKKGTKYTKREHLRLKIVDEIGPLEKEDDYEHLFNFLHDRGTILYHVQAEDPNGLIVLDLRWLIKVLCKIVSVKTHEDEELSLFSLSQDLKEKGILHGELLDHALSAQKLSHIRESLLFTMEKFNLLCKFNDKDGKPAFLVPCMLTTTPEEDLIPTEDEGYAPAYITFDTDYVPAGLFCRILVLLGKWAASKTSCDSQQFFSNAARFIIGDRTCLGLVCHKISIKVHIWSMDSSNPVKRNPTLCEEAFRSLKETLTFLKKECYWMRAVSWKFSGKCNLCLGKIDPKTKNCFRHCKRGCDSDDCAHYVAINSRPFCCVNAKVVDQRLQRTWIQALPSMETDSVSTTQINMGEALHSRKRFKSINSHSFPSSSHCRGSDCALNVTLLAVEWGSSKGGFSTINRNLAINFAKHKRLNVTLFVPKGSCSDEEKKAARRHNVAVREASSPDGYEDVDWLTNPADDFAIDFVFGHGINLGKQAKLKKRTHKCKWVQVVHTTPEDLGMQRKSTDAISKGTKENEIVVNLCRSADVVVTVGPKLKEHYDSFLSLDKKHDDIIQLTPGIFSEFSDVKRVSHKRSKFSVLIYSLIDPEDFYLKGYDLAAKAMAELKNDNYRLLVVGAPEEKLEQIANTFENCGISRAKLAVRSIVKERKNLVKLFCEADLLLMPSRTEAFGLTALEAMSAGLPVLVSENSGFGQVLSTLPSGDQFVVKSNDPCEWARQIANVRRKDIEMRLDEVKALQKYYDASYSWERECSKLVAKMWNIFRDPVSNTLRDDAGKTIENELDSQMLLLQKIARGRGYEISDNEGSGNCMFHALSEQLSRVKRITMSSYELRQAIVQYLRKNPRQPDGTCRSNFVEGWKSWDDYLQHMEQDGSWGDHLILLATANLFKTCIQVVRSLSHHDDVFITSNYCTDDRNPLVLGHVPELHYVSLVRRDANPSE